jgi:hypothetical protein
MLVGDRLNQKNKKLKWPFYEYGNSSLYLAECLQQLGVHETQLLWMNAFSDDCPHLDECVLAGPCSVFFGNLPIIALGDKAYHECLKVGADEARTFKVRHPQWGRRFDAKKAQYLGELKAAFTAAGALSSE